MSPRRGWGPRPWEREKVAAGRVRVVGNGVVATKISLLTVLSDRARLCPQDQSQRVNGGRRLENSCPLRCEDVLRLVCDTATLLSRRDYVLQPSVGAEGGNPRAARIGWSQRDQHHQDYDSTPFRVEEMFGTLTQGNACRATRG